MSIEKSRYRVLFGFTMARIHLVLLALLAVSISVRASSIFPRDAGKDGVHGRAGEV
jgi:hypothetical protein